ncbi:PfaD family polyunsaturated fatty acid/polyketide biosynthesis protein [Streptoalloteichus hindustanus]|uniref:PfaD family protein n=1 Tax=Streptoalloteichus hindustanus TaxID=2017 RepID=A0A1M4YQB4_STRHI|nr:PfaD family polyunsaturated fatty acid/polyketide biosynthesis protein [Streptoalloteichus hindustanus]SHF08005.1 PfaD family protein [Streptoalloteichus hindustanus]
MRLTWSGPEPPRFDPDGVRAALSEVDVPCHVVRGPDGVGVASGGEVGSGGEHELLASAPALPPDRLGAPSFRNDHGVRYAYMAGAMANGVASEDLVVAMARAGMLGSFGAAGLSPERVSAAMDRFTAEIPRLPFACNLIHSPNEPAVERAVAELYLARGVRLVEASAYLNLTPHVVRYRVAGLRRDGAGRVVAENRIIAKLSRPEVAERFLGPPPAPVVADLLAAGLVSAEQAELARRVPMADDLTAEADSAGHTDRRPLSVVLPTLLRLRETVSRRHGWDTAPRVGAAGGIGTPEAVAAAFTMGADYVVTGSVNQSCVEAGTASITKDMLSRVGMADCAMAPAADLFELGVRLQVLRRGTLFPMRARRLYELYREYDSLEALPAQERDRLERQLFRRPISEIWADTAEFHARRDPALVARAENDPRCRMALVFRWYLGMSSEWANTGAPDRVADYQVWCGPAMGAFNDWVRDSHLAAPENRSVVDVAVELLTGAAFHLRVAQLRAAGAEFVGAAVDYRPVRRPPSAARVALTNGRGRG